MSNMPRCAACLLVALGPATLAAAEPNPTPGPESGERSTPVYPAPKKPTKQRILEFLQGGVHWGTDVRYDFSADGTASWHFNGSALCAAPGRFVVGPDSISFECLVQSSMPPSEKRARFKLEVVLVSPDVLVYREEGESGRHVVKHCKKLETSDRYCGDTGEVLVQLTLGSKDRTLYAKARERIEHIDSTDYSVFDFHPAFFEGPQARTLRQESEIFFTKENRALAVALAEILKPILGPLTPKEWPGEWDYGVILVPGSQIATPQETPLPAP